MHAASISQSIDRYLETLRSALDDVPPSERHEVVEEIRTHILERFEQAGEVSESGASEILRAVGDPKELAAQYKTEVMLRRAVRSKSPWLLLNTTLRWSLTGFTGLIAFLLTVMGYGSATVCYLCAVLKPLFPSKIGLWVGPELMLTLGYRSTHFSATELYGISVRAPAQFVLGTLGPTRGPVRELLGSWLSPVALLLGLFFVLVTTQLVRWFIRRFGRRKPRAWA